MLSEIARRSGTSTSRSSCATLIAIYSCFADLDASAEFHVWRDASGYRHISSVPATGFTKSGRIKQDYNPNSIVYQHAKMLAELSAHFEQISDERERQRHKDENGQATMQTVTAPVRSLPREGVMNLGELIELEKRGGRFPGTTTRY